MCLRYVSEFLVEFLLHLNRILPRGYIHICQSQVSSFLDRHSHRHKLGETAVGQEVM